MKSCFDRDFRYTRAIDTDIRETFRRVRNPEEQSMNDRADVAAVSTREGVAATEYSITGSLQAVLREIESILTRYPGLGYGTAVRFMHQLSDGSYGATISRSNSCD